MHFPSFFLLGRKFLLIAATARGEKPNGGISIIPVEDEEIIESVVMGTTPSYSLESKLGDYKRTAGVRREALRRITGRNLNDLPLDGFDYASILSQCWEMPVGFVALPVGIASPLVLDGRTYYVSMATTEGYLVASTNRWCKAIGESGGAQSVVLRDGMTRAPMVRFMLRVQDHWGVTYHVLLFS
ncbi:3-hydroxy-3-methylglutaryl-coenzyme A reductase 3-like [Asparagus officinalis]|uniref:3-hydroxy-3-methylglutaryl-coenzyme A reductase 3-like n=1 Tax=Asparagus officinalis TaxID=4686 RepID=UPI00098E7E1B|nr:3-hydroxy-3-methylglutaryl-coenzyme A reductase 3-like [Asparagus officinalis]